MKKVNPATDLMRSCLELLALRKVFAFRVNNTGVWDAQKKIFRIFAGMKGVADILGILPGGRFLAVEVKYGTGRLSKEQKEFLKAVNDRGGLGVCVHSLDELDRIIRE